jgi:hypothetical protein
LLIGASGGNRRANRASQGFGVGKIAQAGTELWGGIDRLVQAIRPALGVRIESSGNGSAKAPAAAFEYFPLTKALGAGKTDRHHGPTMRSRSSHLGSVDSKDIGKRLTLQRRTPTDTFAVFATNHQKRWLAAGSGAPLKKGHNPSQAGSIEPLRAYSRATNLSKNFGDVRYPMTINFSPTVVVPNDRDHGNIEDKVLEAIRRHSYELVRLIGREVHTQRRAVF